MIRCRLALSAEKIIQDAATRSVTIVTLMERVKPQAFPIILTSFSCLFLLTREESDPPNETPVTFRITLQEQQVYSGSVTVNFQGQFEARLMIALAGVPITSAGVLRTSLLLEEQVLGFYDCIVELPQTPIQLTLPPVSNT